MSRAARYLTRSSLCAVGFLLVTGTHCDVDLEDKFTEPLWCDDALCDWNVVTGEVRRTPTWHQGEVGVELVGDDVVIERSFQDPCELWIFDPVACDESPPPVLPTGLLIEMHVDIAPTATVSIDVDYDGDDVVDWSTEVAGQGFVLRHWFIDTPFVVRFGSITVRKSGDGRAALAGL